ncbi:aspartate-ammonia ligase [Peptoniphilus asaccharolyticus DSM 20463]|uniref:Aspartate--ammonia ligase n=1 Tax=Peptoniphilus asaccharolyticus DSM 20463 TaxID=573058 RepID=A0A1W1UT16_PEPAS|nr:aspartate--ammonia ligase [Peptoniphilus asaccharolyticus]MBL7575141.1 aspartate--ammonia ligase [Peptoniphilus asaccharolyticus]SMB84149.1 aspartate-ammonia ligase [Peptoniphilus asaccharolyticus DSM 20463]
MRNNSEVKSLDLKETQMAIKSLKDYFQRDLANTLNLARISAPIMVRPETGMNDNLSGVERAVAFDFRKYGIGVEIVQSLAKWKRYALNEYGFKYYEGLYADMNALRPDEELDVIHSVYVDQWDWEKIIKAGDRNVEFLKSTVRQIFEVFKRAEEYINQVYPYVLTQKLPEEIFFITSEELLNKYPNMTSKERENAITKEKKAVFIIGIGSKLSNGEPHDSRSADYDDWSLNGDILFWNPVLESAMELSSMGVRVDEKSLAKQLELAGREHLKDLAYHKGVLENTLPLTIGGGIGQSRLCMYFLEKRHIGEVQASVWDEKTIEECKKDGIILL